MRSQAYKPYKALLALLAALTLCLCAACSGNDADNNDDNSGDPIPANATGTYTGTDYLAGQINTALAGLISSSASPNSAVTVTDEGDSSLSGDDISLTINSDNTVSVSVDLSSFSNYITSAVTIPGTCVYSNSTSSFTFTLNYISATPDGMAQLISLYGPTILNQFNPATYSDGALYDSSNAEIFTKNEE